MSLDFVYRNSSVTTSTALLNSKGLPFVAQTPATFSVFDFNGGLITTGAGVQDTQNPEVWSATFSIPAAAPISDMGEKYRLVWLIKNDTETQTATEYFSVRLDGDPISFEAGRIALRGGSVTDCLITDAPATNIHFRLIDESDTPYVDVDVTVTPRQVNGRFIYDYTTQNLENLVPRLSLSPFLGEWTYTDASGTPGFEVHPIYVVSSKMFLMIDNVRRAVDKARNEDINPNLRYTDIDLCHHVLDGISRVNSTPPSLTNFTTENIPFALTSLVKDASVVSALRAQYLAEGVSAFDFQGQTVQLNVDRTQYIQSAIDMLNNDLDERIRKAKKLAIRQSGAGVVGLTVSPSTNFAAMLNARDHMLLMRQRYINR